MLPTLENIFKSAQIETPNKDYVPLHSNTSKEQGVFIQKIFDEIRPVKTLEVGLAYGISTLFILEKHKEYQNASHSHLVIEPFSWGGIAEHNIEKEGLTNLIQFEYKKSDEVLPRLVYQHHKIQMAYVDTTKVFDTVLQDFYFIDKMLEIGGVIIFDDLGGRWPGVQRVARFIDTLPHYKILECHNKIEVTFKRKLVQKIISKVIDIIPFKSKFFPTSYFKTDQELGLDYTCIAFQKKANDNRNWDWDKQF